MGRESNPRPQPDDPEPTGTEDTSRSIRDPIHPLIGEFEGHMRIYRVQHKRGKSFIRIDFRPK